METRGRRVYCAGPLFNGKEREEMAELASRIEDAGFETFLPQRDGLELTRCVDTLVGRGVNRKAAAQVMAEAVFALDVYQVLYECHAVVANLNGRVPDEGTVSEVAMAWARGKPVVGFKADSRSAFGGQDNPLVTGLFRFRLCLTMDKVVERLGHELEAARTEDECRDVREEELSGQVRLGRTIWSALRDSKDVRSLVDVILQFREQAEPAPVRSDG